MPTLLDLMAVFMKLDLPNEAQNLLAQRIRDVEESHRFPTNLWIWMNFKVQKQKS